MTGSFSEQDALIAVMILTSAADNRMTDKELREISAIVDILPVFEGLDKDRLTVVSNMVADLMDEDEGLEALIGMIMDILPENLRETAYALACDVAAADGKVALEEMRMLELLRHRLDLDRLNAAAIERGSRARHMRLPE